MTSRLAPVQEVAMELVFNATGGLTQDRADTSSSIAPCTHQSPVLNENVRDLSHLVRKRFHLLFGHLIEQHGLPRKGLCNFAIRKRNDCLISD